MCYTEKIVEEKRRRRKEEEKIQKIISLFQWLHKI